MSEQIESPQAPPTPSPETAPPEEARAAQLAAEYGDDAPDEAAVTPVSSTSEPPAATPSADAGQPGGPLRAEDGKLLPRKHHSERMIAAARAVQIPDAEIARLSPEELREAVYEVQLLRSVQPAQPAAQPGATPEIDLGIREEDYDPGLIAAMKKLAGENAELKKRLDTVAGQGEALVRERQAQAQAREDDQYDEAFAELPAHVKRLVGEGNRHQFKPDSPEFKRRVKLYHESKQFQGTVKQKLLAAASLLYGDDDTPTPSSLTSYQQQWNSAGTHRPTRRSGADDPPGRDRAIRNLTARLRERGVSTTEE